MKRNLEKNSSPNKIAASKMKRRRRLVMADLKMKRTFVPGIKGKRNKLFVKICGTGWRD
jgi:hypothetical protein